MSEPLIPYDLGVHEPPGGFRNVLWRPAGSDRDKLIEWAKDVEWKFTSYYKYRFTFAAEGPRFTATASVGGDADGIYRLEVQDPMTWDEICSAGQPRLVVKDADGKVIYIYEG